MRERSAIAIQFKNAAATNTGGGERLAIAS